MNLTRRLFLVRSVALAATVYAAPRFKKNPFSLGVMSGDPSPDGFVLWTRLAPDPLAGGGMDAAAVEVDWIVAEDEALRRVVKKGKAVAAPGLAHSVHVEVNGLKSQRPYWYRFKAGAEVSPVGRASTAPKPGEANSHLKFAFASCQNWEAGLWTAYDHMLAEDPDLVVHLGDYIYEGPAHPTAVRPHNSLEIMSLSDYRNRHALYKTDPAIQKMHTHCPWILTWDDHEVDNNYANDVPEDKQPRERVPGAARQRLPGVLRAHAAAHRVASARFEHANVPARALRRTGRIRRVGHAAVSHGPAVRRRNEGAVRRRLRSQGDDHGRRAGGLAEGNSGQVAREMEHHRQPGADGAHRPKAGPGGGALHGSVERLRGLPRSPDEISGGAQTVEPDRNYRRHPLELGERPQGGLEETRSLPSWAPSSRARRSLPAAMVWTSGPPPKRSTQRIPI